MVEIERRVLGDVWIGPWRRRSGCALVAIATIACGLWWMDVSAPPSRGVPVVTATSLVAASALSALALALQRFAWSCAAAYGCGLSSAIGIGAFWWLRTGRSGAPLGWLVVADVAVVAMTVGWVAVVVTPLGRSQPDMRTAASRGDEITSSP